LSAGRKSSAAGGGALSTAAGGGADIESLGASTRGQQTKRRQ
jgi:hypothetical protein